MNDKFPEAGAVAFFSYKRTDGFVINLTLRDTTGKDVLDRIEGAISKVKEQGGVPHEKFGGGFPKKAVNYVEGRVCPKCGSKLVNSVKKKKKKFIKCETNKWNRDLQKAEGCEFIEWEKTFEKTFEKPLPVVDYGEPEDSFPY